jgi:hypothetical protein
MPSMMKIIGSNTVENVESTGRSGAAVFAKTRDGVKMRNIARKRIEYPLV